MSAAAAGKVHLLTGNDSILLADAVKESIEQLASEVEGGIDRSTDLHEFYGEDYLVDQLVVAASTVPLFSSCRLVVARGLSRFSESDLAPLIEYLQQPTPTTSLVLEWGGGRVPKALAEATKNADATKTSASAPTRKRDREDWFAEKLTATNINLDGEAAQLVLNHYGNEMSRIGGLLATLESIFGTGVKLRAADIEPYLGAAGDVPPWDLTDAIDNGKIPAALGVLQRLWQAGAVPMQVIGSLNNHYTRIMKLEGAGAGSKEDAAALLGGGSPFMAGKALNNARRLGRAGVKRAMQLLANADADMKGVSGLDNRCVVEILVGRLAGQRR